MLKLEIRNAAGEVQSNTEHETLALALAEFAGWKDAALQYTITGEVSADCACKRVMESRNRVLMLTLATTFVPEAGAVQQFSAPVPIELKAPQICKLLQTLLHPEALVKLQVTPTKMLVY